MRLIGEAGFPTWRRCVSSYLSLVGARCRVMLHETLYQLLSFCVLVHTSLSVSPKSKRDQTNTPVNRPLFIGVFGNPTAPDGDGTDCDNAVTWNYYVPALAGRRSTRALNTGGPGPFSATGNMLGVLLARNSIEVRSDSTPIDS
ncbi:hypothetical protein BDR07DRAFT_519165 [Suillus spraguei]|nr:hypothetical protein BDR07DRAFT_519165 [Suillus spraguei]